MEYFRISHFNDVRLTILISFLIRNDSLVCNWNVWCIRSVVMSTLVQCVQYSSPSFYHLELLAHIRLHEENVFGIFPLNVESFVFECVIVHLRIFVAKTQSMNIIAISHLAFDVDDIQMNSCQAHTHTHDTHFVRDVRSHVAAAQNFHFILFKHSWHMETITINITVAETTKTTTFVRPKFS